MRVGQSDVTTRVREELEVPLFGGARARRLRRTRRIIAGAAGALAVLLIGGGVFVVTQRNVTTTVSLDDAVRRFREDPAPVAAARERTGVPKTAPAVDRGRPGSQIDAATRPADAAAADAVPAVGPYDVPAEGVYAYRTTGGEEVSMFGASHQYPSRTFGTVRQLGGCKWEHRSEVIEEHVDIRELCGRPGSLTQLMQSREVTFFGTTDGGPTWCDPALVLHGLTEKPGGKNVTRCTDRKGTEIETRRTFVGIERITIGSVDVPAIKVHIDGRMTGRIDGTSSDTLWFHPDHGLTLKWDRSVDTLAEAFGAKVRYRENATFVLESLEPAR